jgi:hypothetical protein
MTGTEILSPGLSQYAKAVQDSFPDPVDRINAIYKHLQHSKRYVSIQVGLGSWKPFPATDVEKNGYGDCKALSNYVASLLNAAGVKAYCALIRAGETPRKFFREFPSMQFNHMIVCVPASPDTMWLECTNMSCAPGHLGPFTAGRPALLITENGGRLVNTPALEYKNNQVITRSEVLVGATGQIDVKETRALSGSFYDEYNAFFGKRDNEVRESLLERYSLSGMMITSCQFRKDEMNLPLIHQQTEFTVKRYATVMGKRVFLIPNLHNRYLMEGTLEGRKAPFIRSFPEAEHDTVMFTLPGSFAPEHLPEDIDITQKEGTYSRHIKVEGNNVFYFRKLELAAGIWKPSETITLSEFLARVSAFDQEQVILKMAD